MKKAELFPNRYIAVRSRVIAAIVAENNTFIKRQNLANYYVLYSEPSIENGYTTLNIEKLEQVINYFALKIKWLYKVLLMKLLWYSDALSYKIINIAITGLIYKHKSMEALPIGHNDIINLPRINVEEIDADTFDYTIYNIPSNENVDFSIISREELEIIDRVISKFKGFSGAKIAEYMHKEYAYTHTESNDIITFVYAK